MTGVIVLGPESPMLEEARRRAHAHRQAEYGVVEHTEYVPPPGHQVVVVEEDLSGATPLAQSVKVSAEKPLTRAQEIAARRRAEREEQRRRRLEGC